MRKIADQGGRASLADFSAQSSDQLSAKWWSKTTSLEQAVEQAVLLPGLHVFQQSKFIAH